MTREAYAGAGWGRAGAHTPGHTAPALQPDSRKVLELNGADVEALCRVLTDGWQFPSTLALRAFLEGARRVRIEVDPRGTVSLGNGFAAAFAAGPGFAHDEPDGEQT